VLRQPGVKEFRGYRHRYGASPQVMVEVEFESLQAADDWLSSKDWSELIMGMRALGCGNFNVAVWDASPIMPEALKP